MRVAVLNNPSSESTKIMRADHIKIVAQDRREHYRKRDLAVSEPSIFLSALVDGADHSAFCLSHVVIKLKEEIERALRVKLIELLHHARPRDLYLFTMMEEHKTRANHISGA